jgi:RecG-like helicase
LTKIHICKNGGVDQRLRLARTMGAAVGALCVCRPRELAMAAMPITATVARRFFERLDIGSGLGVVQSS